MLRLKQPALVACVLLTATSFADNRIGNSSAITGARLKAHLEFIASDLMEGRDTPSRGLDTAALYVSTQLKLWGVKPMGDGGGYLQKYAVIRPAVDSARCSLEFGGKARSYGSDFYGAFPSGSAEGQMVYIGEGWVIPRLKLNPYEQVSVKGKVVVLNGMRPKGINGDDARGLGGATYPEEAAAKYGAKGIVIVPNSDSVDFFADHAASSMKPGSVKVADEDYGVPVAYVSKDLAAEILGGERVSLEELAKQSDARDSKPFELSAGKSIKFKVSVNPNAKWAENVVGMVPGTDPKLASEYVLMSAHLDHLGLQNGDPTKVYNGADDDGSGTVSILELAHAFATGSRPKRSLLFVWHSGEEKGLWGSAYYSSHPTVPIGSIVTDLNIDMIGRSKAPGDKNPRNAVLTGPNEIYIVGASMISKELGKVCVDINNKMYKYTLNYKYDDPKDTERIYYRSDHFNYANKGIPIAFFFDGVHEDYHRMTDKVEKIDFVKMERVDQTVYGIAWAIANAKKRLASDAASSGKRATMN